MAPCEHSRFFHVWVLIIGLLADTRLIPLHSSTSSPLFPLWLLLNRPPLWDPTLRVSSSFLPPHDSSLLRRNLMKGSLPPFSEHTFSPFKSWFFFSLSGIPPLRSRSLWEEGSWIPGSRKGLRTCVLRRRPTLDLVQTLITSKFSPPSALFSGASTYSLATPFPGTFYVLGSFAGSPAVSARCSFVGSIPNRSEMKEVVLRHPARIFFFFTF